MNEYVSENNALHKLICLFTIGFYKIKKFSLPFEERENRLKALGGRL
ncbi:hypothetical protein A45J_2312 [hot springs metagenome]|uniref:Uncharacterized protein n=1 Tax=hot springs metagenome TaxID=433727 RepID=A0A5J4KY65_9ZZZZ